MVGECDLCRRRSVRWRDEFTLLTGQALSSSRCVPAGLFSTPLVIDVRCCSGPPRYARAVCGRRTTEICRARRRAGRYACRHPAAASVRDGELGVQLGPAHERVEDRRRMVIEVTPNPARSIAYECGSGTTATKVNAGSSNALASRESGPDTTTVSTLGVELTASHSPQPPLVSVTTSKASSVPVDESQL